MVYGDQYAAPTNVTSKISLINHKMDRKEFEDTQLMALKGERLDHYRKEYNEVVEEKARESNDMIREMFITVSVEKKDGGGSQGYFSAAGVDLSAVLRQLDSHLQELTLQERLRLFTIASGPRSRNFPLT